jgi:hypothetical protein
MNKPTTDQERLQAVRALSNTQRAPSAEPKIGLLASIERLRSAMKHGPSAEPGEKPL